MGGVDEDLAYATWTIETLLKSGMSLESALKHIATSDYGDVSKEIKTCLQVANTAGLEQALIDASKRTNSKSFKKVLIAIVEGRKMGNLGDSLHSLMDEEMKERKLNVKNYTEKVQSTLQIFLILSALVPILAAAMYGVADLSSFMGTFGISFNIDPGIIDLMFYVDLVIMTVVAVHTKITEPAI